MEKETKKLVLFALYVTSMIVVNVIGTKVSSLFGIRVSVGIILMPLLFVMSDVMQEVYGKKEARKLVNISTGMMCFAVLMIFISIKMPENPTWGLQTEYEKILGASLRMSLASVISFFISQHLDVLTFGLIKKLTDSKYLIVRNYISTVISQFADTVIFMYLAFWKINDGYTAAFVFSLVIPYWIFKIVFALVEVPLCYLGVRWLEK